MKPEVEAKLDKIAMDIYLSLGYSDKNVSKHVDFLRLYEKLKEDIINESAFEAKPLRGVVQIKEELWEEYYPALRYRIWLIDFRLWIKNILQKNKS